MHVKSDDAEIYYEALGTGPALVFLHAFPADHRMWLPVAEKLSTRYRVILPDLRAHGQSNVGSGAATMEKHAADLLNVCRDAGVERALFAGVSIGGYVLFEFLRKQRERVAALILCDTRAGADSDQVRASRFKSIEDTKRFGPEPFIETMLGRLLGETTRRNRPDVVEHVRAMASSVTAERVAAVQQGMAERADSTSLLASIHVPTLLLFGEEDVVTPRADAEALARGIANSTLRMISNAGHFAVFEQADECGRLIRQFCDSHSPSR
jgi:pimeloyl-ACP methyl ester carboxylesterase